VGRLGAALIVLACLILPTGGAVAYGRVTEPHVVSTAHQRAWSTAHRTTLTRPAPGRDCLFVDRRDPDGPCPSALLAVLVP
jgi:hypothetical protein